VAPFADDPVAFVAVYFSPREIVMVVNFFQNSRAENFRYARTRPQLPPGSRKAGCKRRMDSRALRHSRVTDLGETIPCLRCIWLQVRLHRPRLGLPARSENSRRGNFGRSSQPSQFAWREIHGDESYWVVRKGATPAFPAKKDSSAATMGRNEASSSKRRKRFRKVFALQHRPRRRAAS